MVSITSNLLPWLPLVSWPCYIQAGASTASPNKSERHVGTEISKMKFRPVSYRILFGTP